MSFFFKLKYTFNLDIYHARRKDYSWFYLVLGENHARAPEFSNLVV